MPCFKSIQKLRLSPKELDKLLMRLALTNYEVIESLADLAAGLGDPQNVFDRDEVIQRIVNEIIKVQVYNPEQFFKDTSLY